MTVAELIEKLQEYPPDMPVFTWDSENLILNEAKWVGEMGNGEIAGVAIHNYDPAEYGEWTVCA